MISKNWLRILLRLLVTGLAIITYFMLPDSCPEAAKRVAGIFVFAAGFWAFELFPVYVTSLLVVLLLCITLARPGGVLQLDEKGYIVFLAPFSSPVLMLFFGSFVLARAFRKNKTDLFLANRILSSFTKYPKGFISGVIISTALFSMWISNTAATVIMIGILRPLFENRKINVDFRKGVLLSIPFSANIGGIGTPIGTPPNALAIGFLSDFGIFIQFSEWMILCLPLMFLLLIILMFIMTFLFSSLAKKDLILFENQFPLSKEGLKTLLIAFGTIFLWISSPLHGIPESLISLLCAGILMAMDLIDRNDIKNINWDVLILMWGGLALGIGIEKTGLAQWIINTLFFGWKGLSLILLFSTLALSLSLFISNTAASALIIPITLEANPEYRIMSAITVALVCSVAMVFPVSTPPNALAYGTGLITNKEMIKTGAVVTTCSFLIILIGFWWIIPMSL